MRLLLGGLAAWIALTLQPGTAIADPPSRAISQVPSVTEILFALGQGNRLVGVSEYCRFPPEAQDKPKIGGLHDASLEKILTLRPDWAALFAGQTTLAQSLESRGCRIFSTNAETIDEVYETIRMIGGDFEIPAEAEELCQSIQNQIQDLRDKLAGLPRKRVLYIVGREPGSLKQMYGVGSGTFMEEMLNLAGGDSVINPGLGKYPVISRENLILANPEIILDGGADKASKESGTIPGEWRILESVEAVRNQKIVAIDDPHLTIPGPSIPEQIRKLALFIHGADAQKILDAPPLTGP